MSRLIVVSGLPGVGKSTVAALVAGRIGAVHLSVDPVEDAMLGAGLEAGWVTGVAAYEAVRAATETNLALGRTVVVDAVNDSEPARETWRRAAAAGGAVITWIVLTCSDAEEHDRLAGRNRGLALVGKPSWEQVVERGANYALWVDSHANLDTFARSPEELAASIAEISR
jgi:predicted kinase